MTTDSAHGNMTAEIRMKRANDGRRATRTMIKTYIEINADANNPQEVAEAVKLADRFGGSYAIMILNGVVTLAQTESTSRPKTYETWITEEGTDPYEI
jgi:hypothetical protein